MKSQIRNYKHFGECLWLENGNWELGIPLSFGLRVLYFSKTGRENVFYEQPEDADYLCTPEGWRVDGGTRLWFAPESEHALYAPERRSISCQWRGETLIARQAEDRRLHMAKQIEISQTNDPDSVKIVYRLKNTGNEPLVGAAWAVSAMRAGGVLKAPFGPVNAEITARPDRVLSLWNSTSLDDPRVRLTGNAVEIEQLPIDAYFKIGLACAKGAARYELEDQIFEKTFALQNEARYPDGGVNLEVFACRWMLEFETLAPLAEILPGEAAEHTERWTIR